MIEHEVGSPEFISALNTYLNVNETKYVVEAQHTGHIPLIYLW